MHDCVYSWHCTTIVIPTFKCILGGLAYDDALPMILYFNDIRIKYTY